MVTQPSVLQGDYISQHALRSDGGGGLQVRFERAIQLLLQKKNGGRSNGNKTRQVRKKTKRPTRLHRVCYTCIHMYVGTWFSDIFTLVTVLHYVQGD